MPEFAMPGFPEAFRAHTERAHLRPITLALAHVKGPGAAVVYDTANHAFLANVPGEPAPLEPHQVIVFGHADLAEEMARGEVQEATIGELAAALTTQAHAYLAEWADMENLAALGPARRLRAELDRRHYRPHRRACLLGEGARTEFYTSMHAAHLTLAITRPAPREAGAPLQVGLCDLGRRVASWDLPATDEAAKTAAAITQAVNDYRAR